MGVEALVEKDKDYVDIKNGCDGKLCSKGLAFWNMWQGMDLLQAIDLVFLNSLAYGRISDDGRSSHRSQTNRLRKTLWSGISDIIQQHVGENIEMRRQYTPARRG